MSRAIVLALAVTVGVPATALGQSVTAEILSTVRIPTPVLADGKPLPAGVYQLRLATAPSSGPAAQPPGAQRWVEFVADGRVVGRELAEILGDDDLPAIGDSAVRARAGTRVDLLKGGEFVRVSVKRDGERYLLYLPPQP